MKGDQNGGNVEGGLDRMGGDTTSSKDGRIVTVTVLNFVTVCLIDK